MSNVFSLNRFLERNDVDINQFSSSFFASMKKILIFRIEQFHNFFQIRRHRFKLIFARRCSMFKFFIFETTSLFKKINAFSLINRNVVFDEELNKRDLLSKKIFRKNEIDTKVFKKKITFKKMTSKITTRRCFY